MSVFLDVSIAIEGYVMFVTNIHPEAQEDDLVDLFADYGEIRQFDWNLDRRTGYVKGYALIEFAVLEEARRAMEELNSKELYGRKLAIEWAFVPASEEAVQQKPKKVLRSSRYR